MNNIDAIKKRMDRFSLTVHAIDAKEEPTKFIRLDMAQSAVDEVAGKWNVLIDGPPIENINDYNGIEFSPCQQVGPDAIERCQIGEEHFWSVYLHLKEGGCQCICDCRTHDDALLFCQWLKAFTGLDYSLITG